jgi:SAM-dependent methyltransferase
MALEPGLRNELMLDHYATDACLVVSPRQIVAIGGIGSTQVPQPMTSAAALIVLELFVHDTDSDVAFEEFRRIVGGSTDGPGLRLSYPAVEVMLGARRLLVRETSSHQALDLTAHSANVGKTLVRSIARSYEAVEDEPLDPTRESFESVVAELADAGLLSPPRGAVDWGSLRRSHPICKRFGFSRGTPIDRYYLDKFVAQIRNRVVGATVEIGGARQNRELYRLTNVSEYTAIDAEAHDYVDVVGDAHESSLLAPDSADSILAFNVLEHCADPWLVARNMHRWLRTGGCAFCMVPNAQRVHNFPRDYWRPLPDGVNWLFRDFGSRELSQYGNPTSVIASHLGIAAEELTQAELDAQHPDYPVATCIVATK